MRKYRRFFAILLILTLLAPCAFAQEENMFSYLSQPGVEYHMLGDGSSFTAPKGLDALYDLFATGDRDASVCVFRMPNGRALASVSCMPLPRPVTVEELFAARDEIADGLVLSMGETLAAKPDFRLEDFCDQQAMVADLTLMGDRNMPLTAKAVLMCRGSELLEVWTAHPGTLAYVFDPQAEKELKADIRTMAALVDSFLFNDADSTAVPHMNITADNGLFSISAPLDTIVINPGTDADTVARARSRFSELEGGSECFDIWYRDVTETNCWLLLSPEYGVAAEISVATDEYFSDKTLEDFAGRATELLEGQLANQYETVMMGAEPEHVLLDGIPHWWFTYDLSHAGMEMLCYVFCAIHEGTAYELDVFLATNSGKDPDEMSNAVILLMDTLDYLPHTGE